MMFNRGAFALFLNNGGLLVIFLSHDLLDAFVGKESLQLLHVLDVFLLGDGRVVNDRFIVQFHK